MQCDVTRCVICISNKVEYLDKEQRWLCTLQSSSEHLDAFASLAPSATSCCLAKGLMQVDCQDFLATSLMQVFLTRCSHTTSCALSCIVLRQLGDKTCIKAVISASCFKFVPFQTAEVLFEINLNNPKEINQAQYEYI